MTTTIQTIARLNTLLRCLQAVREEVDATVRTMADVEVDASHHLTAAINDLYRAVGALEERTATPTS